MVAIKVFHESTMNTLPVSLRVYLLSGGLFASGSVVNVEKPSTFQGAGQMPRRSNMIEACLARKTCLPCSISLSRIALSVVMAPLPGLNVGEQHFFGGFQRLSPREAALLNDRFPTRHVA